MKLNFRLQNAPSPTSALPIILIHGLFGNLDNLGVLARDLQQHHNVIQVDLRNHGLSPRAPQMDYPVIAQDVLALMDELAITQAIIIGHSMGGKVAMAMTALAPNRVEKLVAIDIAPVNYQVRRHDTIFAALNAVSAAGVTQRNEAAQLMRTLIKEEGVIQFLLNHFRAVNGDLMSLPSGISTRTLLAGSPFPLGHILFCLSVVSYLLIFKTAIEMILPVSSHKPVRMSSPEPVIGSMRKNQILCCGQSTVSLMPHNARFPSC